MASGMRKLIGVSAMALVVGAFAFAGTAGAGIMVDGEGAPPDPGCTFTVTVNDAGGVVPPPPGPVNITVTGSIGGDFAGALVTLVVNGVPGAATPVDPVNGSFVFGPLSVPVPSDVSISYSFGNENAYTNFCIGPGAQSVITVAAGTVTRAPARALAFTGSDDTTRNVLIGVAAVVLGTVLVVATRRRSRIRA